MNIRIIITTLAFLASTALFAQEAETPKVQTITVKTAICCNNCGGKIVKDLGYTKGVKDASVDAENNTIEVAYKTAKCDAATVRNAIAEMGFPADDVPADPKALSKLPSCCQNGRH